MSKQNLREMDDDDAEAVLDFIRGRLDDERYPSRLKIWAIAKRCEQIDVDSQ
jgi:hypothetical protein